MFPILAAGSPEAVSPSLPAFLVAHDGLYLRKRSLLGVSQTKVDGAEHLSAEKEYVEYVLPKVPLDLMARVVGFFRAIYRRQATEALVLLLWTGEGFDLMRAQAEGEPGLGEPHARRGRAPVWISSRRLDPLPRGLWRRGEFDRRRR